MDDTIRILVVDDDPDVAMGTCRVLEQAGYLTSVAGTGAEALQLVRDVRPPLVLLDRHLPDMDGIAVCQQIKFDPALAGTLVVMASASRATEPERIDGLKAGADGYIVRPIGNQELIARVEAFVRILRLNQAYRAQAISLRDSVERFALAARATNDAIWDWNISTDALWWNVTFQTLFGYGPDEVEPRLEAWASLIHPDDLERVETGLRDVITGADTGWSDEYRFRRKDGSYADVLDRAFISRDAGGRAVRAVGAMADLSARRRAERDATDALADATRLRETLARQLVELQAANEGLVASRRAALNLMDDAIEAQGELRRSEEKWRSIVTTSPDGIIVTSLDGVVLEASPSAATMFGYARQYEAIGRAFSERVHPSHRERAQRQIDGLVGGEPLGRGEYPAIKTDGTDFYMEASAEVLRDASGTPVSLIFVVRDISERRQADQLIQEQMTELRRWNAATLGRESRIIELKWEVNRLLEASGQPARYASGDVAPIGEVPHG